MMDPVIVISWMKAADAPGSHPPHGQLLVGRKIPKRGAGDPV